MNIDKGDCMKKIFFLQNEGKVLGGVFQVNKTLGLEFYRRGYEVTILSFRNNKSDFYEETPFKQVAINEKDEWKFVFKRDVLSSFSKGIRTFLKTLKLHVEQQKKLKKDYEDMKMYILRERPDFIIASHYQTLLGIPKEYLSRTVFVQHSTYHALECDRKNYDILKKFNHQLLRLAWLSESAMNAAIKNGFDNSIYIYNPIRFRCDNRALVKKNKTIICLSRFSPEKRIDLMVKIVADVFNDKKFKTWKLKLYGTGKLDNETEKIINNSKQIFNMGITDEPRNVLLKSSLILNTSKVEGFPLSLNEAFACGVPALSFNYGEAAKEQIINDYNGYVVDQDNISEFKNKLIMLLSDLDKLEILGKNAKEFSNKFDVEKICDEWERLFNEKIKRKPKKSN